MAAALALQPGPALAAAPPVLEGPPFALVPARLLEFQRPLPPERRYVPFQKRPPPVNKQKLIIDFDPASLFRTGAVLIVAAAGACFFWLPALQTKWKETQEAAQLATFIRQYASDGQEDSPPGAKSPEEEFLDLKGSLLAVVVSIGACVGLLVYMFVLSIRGLEQVAEELEELSMVYTILIPFLGGLGVVLLREAVGGFEDSSESAPPPVSLQERFSRLVRPAARAVAAVFTLGTGNSLGPEGPAVDIGKAVARFFGGFMGESSKPYTTAILAAGAASGIAAGFNAPISGVFFALETVFQTQPKDSKNTPALVAGVLLAAVLACSVVRFGLGDQPFVIVPKFNQPLVPPLAGLTYLLLGYLAGEISLGFTNACKATAVGFKRLATLVPADLFPPLVGLLTGAISLTYPEIGYRGFANINGLLQADNLTLNTLLELVIMKVALTSVARSSGLVGGIYAPSLFMGAAVGTIYGEVVTAILTPLGLAVPPIVSYSVVGMAATLGSACRVPLTGVLLLFELTRDYGLLVPTALATASAMQVVRDVTPALSIPILEGPLLWKRIEEDPPAPAPATVPSALDGPGPSPTSAVPVLPTVVVQGDGPTFVLTHPLPPAVAVEAAAHHEPASAGHAADSPALIPTLVLSEVPPVTVKLNDDVRDALRRLLERRQWLAVVVDDAGCVAAPGLVTVPEVHAAASQPAHCTIGQLPPVPEPRIASASRPVTQGQLLQSCTHALVLQDPLTRQPTAVVTTFELMARLSDESWLDTYSLPPIVKETSAAVKHP
eukprot:EG_transcript_3409